jgi:hypothetical protein
VWFSLERRILTAGRLFKDLLSDRLHAEPMTGENPEAWIATTHRRQVVQHPLKGDVSGAVIFELIAAGTHKVR